MTWAAVIVGGAAVAGGTYLGAQSKKSAASKAQEFYWNRTDEGLGRLGRYAFGDPYFGGLMNGTAGGMTPGGYVGQLYGQADQSRQMGDDVIRDYNTRFGNLAGASRENLSATGLDYDNALAGIMSRGRDAEGLAADFGREREGVIRGDNAAQRKGAQARLRANLNASGFGSSTARGTDAAGVDVQYDRALDDQLATVADTRLGAQMAARGQTNQQAAALAGQRSGTLANMRETDIGRRYAVSAAFPELAMALQNRNFALENQAGQTGMGVLSGATFNPWLNTNVSAFYPGVSPIGGALQSAGSTVGGLGGMAMGAGGWGNLSQGVNAAGNPLWPYQG